MDAGGTCDKKGSPPDAAGTLPFSQTGGVLTIFSLIRGVSEWECWNFSRKGVVCIMLVWGCVRCGCENLVLIAQIFGPNLA